MKFMVTMKVVVVPLPGEEQTLQGIRDNAHEFVKELSQEPGIERADVEVTELPE